MQCYLPDDVTGQMLVESDGEVSVTQQETFTDKEILKAISRKKKR